MTATSRTAALAAVVSLGGCGPAPAPASPTPAAAPNDTCGAATFEDRSAPGADRNVGFGGESGSGPFSYAPRCLRIAPGETVTFVGDFSVHPLAPGTAPGTERSDNPIPRVGSGTTPTPVSFPAAGRYPYYCTQHYAAGMAGVVEVSGAPVANATAPSRPPPSVAEAPPSRTPFVTATRFVAQLHALGLDAAHLPPLESLPKPQLRLLMDTVSEATGADCFECHTSENDMAAMTPRKRVAMKMWDQWVRGFALASSEPVFCDSCHHGSLTFLDRERPLQTWMRQNFVAGVTRVDHGAQECASCHGKPFNGHFLEDWRKP